MPSRFRTHESRDAAAEQWRADHPTGIVVGIFGKLRKKAVCVDLHRVFMNVYLRDVNEDGSIRMPGFVLHRETLAPLARLLADAGLVIDHEAAEMDRLADKLSEQP